MNVLIFGANGYIGKHLTRLLATKKSINILASDIHNNSFFEEKIEYIQIDLSNKTKVENIDFSNFDIIPLIIPKLFLKVICIPYGPCFNIKFLEIFYYLIFRNFI